MKIAIIGASGQGKTTLVKSLVGLLKSDHYNAIDVVEYARSYIEKNGLPESIWEQLQIANGQWKREKRASEKYDIVICDSTAWLAAVYASYMMDKTKTKDVYAFRKVLKKALETYNEYDYCFYLPKMFEVQKDSVRSEWEDDLNKQAETIDKKVMAFMELFDIKYTRVECTENMDRVNYIRKCIGIDIQ